MAKSFTIFSCMLRPCAISSRPKHDLEKGYNHMDRVRHVRFKGAIGWSLMVVTSLGLSACGGSGGSPRATQPKVVHQETNSTTSTKPTTTTAPPSAVQIDLKLETDDGFTANLHLVVGNHLSLQPGKIGFLAFADAPFYSQLTKAELPVDAASVTNTAPGGRTEGLGPMEISSYYPLPNTLLPSALCSGASTCSNGYLEVIQEILPDDCSTACAVMSFTGTIPMSAGDPKLAEFAGSTQSFRVVFAKVSPSPDESPCGGGYGAGGGDGPTFDCAVLAYPTMGYGIQFPESSRADAVSLTHELPAYVVVSTRVQLSVSKSMKSATCTSYPEYVFVIRVSDHHLVGPEESDPAMPRDLCD